MWAGLISLIYSALCAEDMLVVLATSGVRRMIERNKNGQLIRAVGLVSEGFSRLPRF